jgi:enterochelin esterase-like enzyme
MTPRIALRAPSLVLLLLLALLLTALAGAPQRASGEELPASDDREPFALDLSGKWRFNTGDDPAWSNPGFDHSSWKRVQVPKEGGQKVFADYDGYAWFRLRFRLPASAQGTPLVASLGGIDDADEAYLNGVKIGSTGEFPPDEDSQWFEQRLYPVPAGAPNYGGRNVLAIRMNDFTGGGGWYRGPVGLFSKAALRSELYGLNTSPASREERTAVRRILDRQQDAFAAGRFKAYRRTLADGFFHDGDTVARRMADLRALAEKFGPLTLHDTEVQIVRDDDSDALIADTNRMITGRDEDGNRVVVQPLKQDFLYFGGSRLREVGNHSRFFMDSVRSELEGQVREFAVYLPPSYLRHPNRSYPTVYLLHGINGGAEEWDTRDIDGRIDRLIRDRGIEESVVIMPDGESLWYVDSSASPWRSMFVEEMVPLVDQWYRTKERRGMRGLTGVSMGGHGAFTIGWSQPQLFSSIASHMGALDLPPLAGTEEDIAENSDQTPNVQVNGHTPEFLNRYTYFFDACEEDDFKFDDAARAMDGQLTSKLVPHRTVIYPTGRHNDECWVPHLYKSFDLHSDSFRSHDKD